jgi:hypothetical protein
MESAPAEQALMSELRSLVFKPEVWLFLAGAAYYLRHELANDPAADMKFVTIPLGTYGVELPSGISSSWVFVLKHAAAFQAERHPNSIQRMFSLWNSGIMDVWKNGKCRSHTLLVSPADPGLTIPLLMWHRPRAINGNWAVVSFHTAHAEELTEELGDPTIDEIQSSRRYIDGTI